MANRKTNKAIQQNKKNKKTRKMYKKHKNKTKGGNENDTSMNTTTGNIFDYNDDVNNNNKKTKKKEESKPEYNKMGLDVIITKPEGEKRKLEFNVRSFYHFYDYLNEVDMFLKNTLNEELLEFNDPNKYSKWKEARKPIIYSYNYGYNKPDKGKNNDKSDDKNKDESYDIIDNIMNITSDNE